MQLDAVTIDINETFDCIYSNKVLMHLSRDEFRKSLHHQSEKLNTNGILFFSLWYGNSSENYDGLLFNYYTEESILPYLPKSLLIEAIKRYTEEEENDSLYVVLRKADID